MPVSVAATCSECYTVQDVEVGPGIKEVTCSNCGHSVPSLEAREVAVVQQVKAQERWKTLLTICLMGGAAFLLVLHLIVNRALPPFSGRGLCLRTQLTHEGTALQGKIIHRSGVDVTFVDDEGNEATYDLNEVDIQPMPQSEAFQLFFYLSILVGLAGVVAAALASSQRVVVEF